MGPRRAFVRKGQDCFDSYTDEQGRACAVRVPIVRVDRLVWASSRVPDPPGRAPTEVARARRERLLEKLASRESPVTVRDYVEAGRVGDSEVAELLGRRMADVQRRAHLEAGDISGKREEFALLVAAAEAMLTLVPCHVGAAVMLSELLYSARDEDARARVAAAVAAVYRPESHGEAMTCLRDALVRLLSRAPQRPQWGPDMIACVGVLLDIDRAMVLARCRDYLRMPHERVRRDVIWRLGRVAGGDVASVLVAHVRKETSPRLRVDLLVLVGDLLSRRAREQILLAALANESPWWRWQALQQLWRVPPAVAIQLAGTALAAEVDPLLRTLLSDAAEAASAIAL